MRFNYSKLRGLLVEKGLTTHQFAEIIGVGPTSISQRLTGSLEFKQSEIAKAVSALQIPWEEVNDYFFLVESTENRE